MKESELIIKKNKNTNLLWVKTAFLFYKVYYWYYIILTADFD